MSARFRWTLTNTPPPFSGPVTTEVLTKDPIGWENISLNLTRHPIYNGVFCEVSFDVKWHCNGGGKEFIDGVYQTFDINGNITCLIEIDCDSSGTYIELYTGKINLASYTTDGEYTTCNIEKSDLFTKLKARDEINVDLETTTSIGAEAITGIGTKTLPMHSMLIKYENEWTIKDGYVYTTDIGIASPDPEPIVGFFSHSAPIKSADIENTSSPWIEMDDGSTAVWEESVIEPLVTFNEGGINYPIQINWQIDFNGVYTDAKISGVDRENVKFGLLIGWGKRSPDVGSMNIQLLYSNAGYDSDPFTANFSIQDTGSFFVNEGDSIWLSWFIQENETFGQAVRLTWAYGDSFFKFNTTTEYDPTAAKSVLIHEAFNQVCDAIADNNLRFYSDFYGRQDSEKITYAVDGCGSEIAISNGFNIREFDNKNIFCNLKELFNSANALHNIGLTIEEVATIYAGTLEVIRVEPIAYFFDTSTQILSLTKPVKVETRNDNSRYFNDILIGYEKWESEFKGGLDEPCSKHEYSTKINAVKGQYQRLSKYVASAYAIELTRRKSRFPSEDWRYDNDNFFIATKNVFIGPVSFLDGLGVIGGMIIDGLSLDNIHPGDILEISGTLLNDGTYTVTVVSEIYSGGIMVTMIEPTVAESAAITTIDNIYDPIYSPQKYLDFLTLVLPTGMQQPFTAYNLRLTPARMLQPHMKTISAGLTLITGQVKFINGEGNTTLKTQFTDNSCPESYNGEPLVESDSLPWNDNAVNDVTPLWIPEIYNFEYPITAAQLASIRATPHGYISVTDDHGNVRSGFILDVEYRLKTGLTKFQLLRKN